jgi:coenzyme F420-reducing hydrogenase beta subunit
MVTVGIRQVEGDGVTPVIANGFCIGCGACAALPDAAHTMVMSPNGQLVARPADLNDPAVDQRAGTVCPFSDQGPNEDQLADELFPDTTRHPQLGAVLSTHAGYVVDGGFRQRGSSGGMGTWILEQLLVQGYVDAVVHVGEGSAELVDEGSPRLFRYRVSRTVEQLRAGAKSRYYPVTLADVVGELRKRPGRYAFSGVPCFIKAIRRMARQDRDFGRNVAFCLGLVCGHLKSRGFAEFLSWQMGIPPAALERFDFRHKMPGRAANRYGAMAQGQVHGQVVQRMAAMQELYGHDWGMGLFKPKACDYCDDVVAETADVTVGDAWLPRFVRDDQGTNLLVVRHATIAALLRTAHAQGQIRLEDLSADEVVQSQASGFSHRREGLAYRLSLSDAEGHWRPLKRVQPAETGRGHVFEHRHRLRMQLARSSHQAFRAARAAGDLRLFFKEVVPLAESYRDLSRTRWKRWLARLKRWVHGDAAVSRALQNNAEVQRD